MLRDKYKPPIQIPSTVNMNSLHHNIYVTNNKEKKRKHSEKHGLNVTLIKKQHKMTKFHFSLE